MNLLSEKDIQFIVKQKHTHQDEWLSCLALKVPRYKFRAAVLYLKPQPLSKVAQILGISGQTVRRWLKDMGLPKRTGAYSRGLEGYKTKETRMIRNSPKHKEWSLNVMKRDDFTCQECGKRGGNLHAHHIKDFAKNENMRFELTNGQTLCVGCHIELHRMLKKINIF